VAPSALLIDTSPNKPHCPDELPPESNLCIRRYIPQISFLKISKDFFVKDFFVKDFFVKDFFVKDFQRSP